MLLGEFDAALPLAVRAVEIAQQVGGAAEHAQGLATLGVVQAQRGELDAGLAALATSFRLALGACSLENIVRAAANQMYLLITAGRFAEALQVARDGREAARSLGAPPALTWVLDNNAATVLFATGRWAEADQLLAELDGELARTRPILQLLRLELAAARGESERAAELSADLGKSPEDPRVTGSLHACLAEQALMPVTWPRPRTRWPKGWPRCAMPPWPRKRSGSSPPVPASRPSWHCCPPGPGPAIWPPGGRNWRPPSPTWSCDHRPVLRMNGGGRLRGPGHRRAGPPGREGRPGHLAAVAQAWQVAGRALPGGIRAAARGRGGSQDRAREEAPAPWPPARS